MFEVLVFVYENYWRGAECPEPGALERKLNAVGFDADEVQDAMAWLKDLNRAARCLEPGAVSPTESREAQPAEHQPWAPSPNSMRVYSRAEQDHLGAKGLGFISFLETAGKLPGHMREIVIERAMAACTAPLPLDDLKIIVLMVYWRLGEEPDALVLDELCEDTSSRVAH
jgi:Smg protein